MAEDFREIKALGANVVRIHLQLAKFVIAPGESDARNIEKLRQLLALAEESGLYLDLTGLGCYRKSDVPEWYDQLDEQARWNIQAEFWRAIASACKDSPAVFCYDLMNEPILPGEKPAAAWLGAAFAGKHFVQRISLDLAGRSREDVARQWVEQMVAAIRRHDT